ncbi:EF hand domain containing protein [Entamoeba nuttalli P19]|uniref:EF hand domain containing protein n=2 Tax=Entamoeba nuttalli TaxID=412467 RepID=K2H541_ENTNP|nr:EF hand domain containing protein [Entamoeba nuttalli P19]EKE41522.1 EF hand domain containing protein [Entamoeba nuttalli P19]|eukprot:XP_008856148.1 EF hand domain containing protein [Entamoeba nuttalli P19]
MSKQLRQTFDEMDLDKDGVLTLVEFLQSAQKFGVSSEQIKTIFETMDIESSGAMGLFEKIDEDNQLQFIRDNIHIINNWTGLRCKEILMDSKYDLWVDNKAYVLAHYIYQQKNIVFLLICDKYCFGFFNSQCLQSYNSNHIQYIQKGNEFFSFVIYKENISPKISEVQFGKTEIIGIPSKEDTEKIFEIKDGMVLDTHFIATFTQEFHKIYGLNNLETNIPLQIKRFIVLKFE